MAQSDETTVSYVMILNIQKITKKLPRTTNYNNTTKQEEKSETEVIKLVIRDNDLTRLKQRANSHIDLVQDEDNNA